mmetsp:Transcript_59063/g.175613  ORF Transcript_59063/g.175613 Transcript_59063/m.175613 type:complete len:250 (-) Transcript_59063:57-806(-)
MQFRLDGQNILANQTPNWDMINTQFLEEVCPTGQAGPLRGINEHLELNDARAFHHCPSQHVNKGYGAGESAARRDQIVNDEDAITLGYLVALDSHSLPRSILRLVRLRLNRIGHLPLLSHHNERLLEGQGDGRTEDESARVQPRHGVDADFAVPRRKDVHDLLEYVRIGKETANVVETGNALERKVREVLGDLLCLRTILHVILLALGRVRAPVRGGLRLCEGLIFVRGHSFGCRFCGGAMDERSCVLL